MKRIIMCLIFMIAQSLYVVAQTTPSGKQKQDAFQIVPLNSPVKGPNADFSFGLPPGFEADKMKIRLVKAHELKPKDLKNEMIKSSTNYFSIDVSKLSPGFYRLFIVAIDKKSGRELPYSNEFHDYIRFTIDESMEVPMPDPKLNNATIEGIDSDKNGIRDDIQRIINEKYRADPIRKMIVRQYATTQQQVLLTSSNEQLSIAAMKDHLNSSLCWSGYMGVRIADEERTSWKAQIINTKERLIAERTANLNFHGQGGEIPRNKKAFCSFD